jgi:very-short-patch-repair endonuclease
MRNLTSLARKQRKSKNPWEYKLWQYLRSHRFYGLQFKRQIPMGKYIVDFCCRSKMLIIELDGGQHAEKIVSKNDREKQRFLEELGFRVLRFWNNDVDDNLEGVLATIKKYI